MTQNDVDVKGPIFMHVVHNTKALDLAIVDIVVMVNGINYPHVLFCFCHCPSLLRLLITKMGVRAASMFTFLPMHC